jgi:hypothetical protein
LRKQRNPHGALGIEAKILFVRVRTKRIVADSPPRRGTPKEKITDNLNY